jgi:hypothetical protein
MSVTSDIRAYADSAINTAVSTGKQTLSAAQAQFGGVTNSANEIVGDLRNSAEKVVNVDAVRTAIEPYLAQLRGYGDEVGDRIEEIVATLKNDPRFGKLVETADSLSSVVLEIIQERVVKPVQSLTGGAKSEPARKPAPKPAATRPATKPAATKSTASTTRRPATKTTARKAPAKRATTTSANGTAKS